MTVEPLAAVCPGNVAAGLAVKFTPSGNGASLKVLAISFPVPRGSPNMLVCRAKRPKMVTELIFKPACSSLWEAGPR
jgi:hypothetical protein